MGTKVMILLGICMIVALLIVPEVAARQLAHSSTFKPKAKKTNEVNDSKFDYPGYSGIPSYGGPGGGGIPSYGGPGGGAIPSYGGPGGGGIPSYGGLGGGGIPSYGGPGGGGYQYGRPGGGWYPGHGR